MVDSYSYFRLCVGLFCIGISSLPCSQMPATVSDTELVESSFSIHTMFLSFSTINCNLYYHPISVFSQSFLIKILH
jgi:hypothetical protein